MLAPQTEFPAASYKQVTGGYLEGMDTPAGFEVRRLHFTDPAMYLRQEFSPGSIYHPMSNGTGG